MSDGAEVEPVGLFNLFGKRDAPDLRKALDPLSTEIMTAVTSACSEGGRAHAETVLAALGAVTGKLMLLEGFPGIAQAAHPSDGGATLVASPEVDELAAAAIGVLASSLQKFGLDVPAELGTVEIPAAHRPLREPKVMAKELSPRVVSILDGKNIPSKDRPLFCVIAAVKVIKSTEKILPSGIAAQVFLDAMAESAKSLPLK